MVAGLTPSAQDTSDEGVTVQAQREVLTTAETTFSEELSSLPYDQLMDTVRAQQPRSFYVSDEAQGTTTL